MFRIVVLLILALLPLVNAQTPPAAAPATEPIAATQVAIRSEELTRTLRDISRSLPPDSELTAFNERLREQEADVRAGLKNSASAAEGNAALMEIREEIRTWRSYSVGEARQRKTLTDWGAVCEESLDTLTRERGIWQATLKAARESPEFKTVIPTVRKAISDIDAVRNTAEQRLRVVLDLQARLSRHSLTVADQVEKLSLARQRVHAHLFYPDAPPIWQLELGEQTESMRTILARSLSGVGSGLSRFVSGRKGALTAAFLLIAVMFVAFYKLRKMAAGPQQPDERLALAAKLLGRPVAMALLLASPLAFVSFPLARMSGVFLVSQVFLIPITRLLPLYTSAHRLIYFLAAFFALNGVVGVLEVDLQTKRVLLAILTAVTIGVLLWWGRPNLIRRAPVTATDARREVQFARLAAAILAPGFISNIAGFLVLTHLLRLPTLVCVCFALVLYTLVRVSTTLFSALLLIPGVRSLATVRLHEAGLLRWCERSLAVLAGACWFYLTLVLLELHEPVTGAIGEILNARPGTRVFNVSLGDVLGFVGVLLVGYLFASALRFILREEVLWRWRLSRGLPETISTSVYYIALLLVFFMSLSAAGIQLDKLTVLTGAFGVGIGFGLQNVVNNFVSGIILQFERPIRVGDVLEVGPLAGEIRRIGVRSSTMRTFQGAEVIIPNSTFVSDQVINWTLSEPRRRVDIPVHVAYGTDPQQIINMLVGIAAGQPGVLPDPEPCAVFQGFGESSMDFLLMFWAEQDTHFRLRSEVFVVINTRLKEAGIEVPFPQREVRVLPGAAFKQSA